MKNLKRLFILLFALILVVPFGVLAEEDEEVETTAKAGGILDMYNTTNLVETLEAENIELVNKDYTENSKQAVIYLFRGQGCSHCQEFLTFLSSLTEEYGEYFRLVAFETWKDTANSELMSEVAESLNTEASGVPFIIIGSQFFGGYASDYDESIKQAIMDLYNTDVEKRYDIFANKKEPKDHSVAVGVVSVLVIGGIVAAAVVTRKNNG